MKPNGILFGLIALVTISSGGFIYSLFAKPKEEKKIGELLPKEEIIEYEQVLPPKEEEHIEKPPKERIIEEKIIIKEQKTKEAERLKTQVKDLSSKIKEIEEKYQRQIKELLVDIEDAKRNEGLLKSSLENLQQEAIDLQKLKANFKQENERLRQQTEEFQIALLEQSQLGKEMSQENFKLKQQLNSLLSNLKETNKKILLSTELLLSELRQLPKIVLEEEKLKGFDDEYTKAKELYNRESYLKSIEKLMNLREEAKAFFLVSKEKIKNYNKTLFERILTLFLL